MKTRHWIAGAAAVALTTLAMTAVAQQLPKSGTISVHTGTKWTGDFVTVADKHVRGSGHTAGVTFNDRGAGPLHLGPMHCYDAFFTIDGQGKNKGVCAFGDTDGDRIFVDYTGTLTPEGASGINEISGGTGKYAGITGSGPWKCKFAGANGELQCTQRFDYRLP